MRPYFVALFLTAPLLACKQPVADNGKNSEMIDQNETNEVGILGAPEQLAVGIYYMRQPDRVWSSVIGNVGLIEQSDGFVLFDTGGTVQDGRQIAAEVSRMGNKPVKAIVLSHWHGDHPFGVPGILETYPDARIIAHPKTDRLLLEKYGKDMGVGELDRKLNEAANEGYEAAFKSYAKRSKDPELSVEERQGFATDLQFLRNRSEKELENFIVRPTETVSDRLLIDDAERPVELRFLGRGNTPGDIVAWLPQQRIVFTGDSVIAPSPYGFSVHIDAWIAMLGRLKDLDFNLLVPGHGAVMGDQSYIDKMRDSLTVLRDYALDAKARGISEEDAIKEFDASAEYARFGANDAWKRFIVDVYWIKKVIPSAYEFSK